MVRLETLPDWTGRRSLREKSVVTQPIFNITGEEEPGIKIRNPKFEIRDPK
jgi:hypothetical protein